MKKVCGKYFNHVRLIKYAVKTEERDLGEINTKQYKSYNLQNSIHHSAFVAHIEIYFCVKLKAEYKNEPMKL